MWWLIILIQIWLLTFHTFKISCCPSLCYLGGGHNNFKIGVSTFWWFRSGVPPCLERRLNWVYVWTLFIDLDRLTILFLDIKVGVGTSFYVHCLYMGIFIVLGTPCLCYSRALLPLVLSPSFSFCLGWWHVGSFRWIGHVMKSFRLFYLVLSDVDGCIIVDDRSQI